MNSTTIAEAADAYAATIEVEAMTRCESPRAPRRQAQTRAEMFHRLAADHLEEVLWCARGAAAYARFAQGSVEEGNALHRLDRELELLWHSLQAHAGASLARDAELAREPSAPRLRPPSSLRHRARQAHPSRAASPVAAAHAPRKARLREMGRSRFGLGVLALVVALAVFSSASAQAGPNDPYLAAMQQAAAHERGGRYRQGAETLAEIAARFPQDHRLALRLGWLWFQAREYVLAERAYRHALKISGGDAAARTGVAWCLLRLRHREAAAAEFRAVLTRHPGHIQARTGLSLTRSAPLVKVEPSIRLATQQFSGHPTRESAVGMSLRLPVVLGDHLLLGATYRVWSFRLRSDLLDSQGSSGSTQHEGHFALGWTTPIAAVAAHYSVLEDGSGEIGRGHVAGLTARWSPWGDLLLDTSISSYPDLTVARVGLSWSLPLGSSFRLVPGLALQRTDTESLASGSLTLVYARPTWSAWVGGKLGDEVRPAVLSLASVSNLSERILGGAWAGARVRLGKGVSLFGTYGIQALATDPTTSAAHTLSVGLSWRPAR